MSENYREQLREANRAFRQLARRHARIGDIRYRAEWLESFGDQNDEEFNPDLCVFASKVCADKQSAAKWAKSHDINQEGSILEESCIIGGIAAVWSGERFSADDVLDAVAVWASGRRS